jgi:hypothetical protein
MYNSGGAMILIQRGQEFFFFFLFLRKLWVKKLKLKKIWLKILNNITNEINKQFNKI